MLDEFTELPVVVSEDDVTLSRVKLVLLDLGEGNVQGNVTCKH